jgi:hypothetical protein
MAAVRRLLGTLKYLDPENHPVQVHHKKNMTKFGLPTVVALAHSSGTESTNSNQQHHVPIHAGKKTKNLLL